MREKAELQSQVEENEEDLNDVMRKYKAVVQQVYIVHCNFIYHLLIFVWIF